MSLINRFGKSRTVQHIILVWIKRFQVDYATNNSENYTISLIKSVQREREKGREWVKPMRCVLHLLYFVVTREELECESEWNHLYWIPLLSHVGCWISHKRCGKILIWSRKSAFTRYQTFWITKLANKNEIVYKEINNSHVNHSLFLSLFFIFYLKDTAPFGSC